MIKAPARFRTVLHGDCLLEGKRPPGSRLARECPVLRRQRRAASRPATPPKRA